MDPTPYERADPQPLARHGRIFAGVKRLLRLNRHGERRGERERADHGLESHSLSSRLRAHGKTTRLQA
jgi:hypothetical protein